MKYADAFAYAVSAENRCGYNALAQSQFINKTENPICGEGYATNVFRQVRALEG